MKSTRVLAGLAAAVVALGLTTAPAEAQAPTPQLHTGVSFPTRTVTDLTGNTLLADKQGRALQLRGTNLGKFDDIVEQDVADMGAAGFTLLRLPIQWRRLEPEQGQYDASYLAHIEDVLDWADRYGLLVLVDWHQDVFGPYFGFDGVPAWATRDDGIEFEPVEGNWFNNYFKPAVQAAFKHLYNDEDLQQAQVATWTYLAQQLAGEPALLGYDLFNEPMWTANTFETNELPAMYRRLIAGIRTVDQRSWLWVEPTVLVGEGVSTQLPAFDDPRHGADRIGYAPHAYSTSVEDGGDWDASSGFVERYEAAITKYPRTNKMPVLVGEWGPIGAGETYPGNVELVRQQAASFERFASGWAIWYGCRSATGGGYCIFADDEGHLDPGRAAAWTPYALTLAGTRLSGVSTTKRFVLTYLPGGKGSTQVVVPSGYGDRLAVSITAGKKKAKGVRAVVSKPTRTGARTVTIAGKVRKHAKLKVTIKPR